MSKVIIKLEPNAVVKIENNLLIIETKENTTTVNSDVKCFGTSANPMTETEWKDYLEENNPVPFAT